MTLSQAIPFIDCFATFLNHHPGLKKETAAAFELLWAWHALVYLIGPKSVVYRTEDSKYCDWKRKVAQFLWWHLQPSFEKYTMPEVASDLNAVADIILACGHWNDEQGRALRRLASAIDRFYENRVQNWLSEYQRNQALKKLDQPQAN